MSTLERAMGEKMRGKKVIAWGAGKLLEFFRLNVGSPTLAYAVDSNAALHGTTMCGVEIKSPQDLLVEDSRETVVLIFVVSNVSVQEILRTLHLWGGLLHRNVFLYADVFYESFQQKFEKIFGRRIDDHNYTFVKSFLLSTHVQTHTTLLGNLLFLELLSEVQKEHERFSVAELGTFHGGNALLALLWLTQHQHSAQDASFYLLDSFEGFSPVSRFDPQDKQQGDYRVTCSFESVLDSFSPYLSAHIVKGFIPTTFVHLDEHRQYHLVFYDCDLYEPALASFDYFWKRIVPGGYLLIHDYIAETGGYHGVRKATDEFFRNKHVQVHAFWENTAALVVKPRA